MARREQKNNYTKLADGTWGAWINMEYDGSLKSIEPGTEVEILTKRGEVHKRIVTGTVTSYKSGCKVSLEPDHEIARVAKARYQAKVARNNPREINYVELHSNGQTCPKCHGYCYGDCEVNR